MTMTVKAIEPTGVLDGVATNELKHKVLGILDKVDILILDLRDITFMNSSGIGALVALLKSVRAQDKQLYLCGLSDQVKMIFQLTKMDRVFTIYRDRQAIEHSLTESLHHSA